MSFEYNNKEHWVFRVFLDFYILQKPEKPENPKLIKQIIYIDNKRLMILQSNSADILSDTHKKSAEIQYQKEYSLLFLMYFAYSWHLIPPCPSGQKSDESFYSPTLIVLPTSPHIALSDDRATNLL